MAEENKIRDALDAAKGFAEALPVYQDVVQPAAKEVGTALQTVAKMIHVVLAPVSALVWGYDKICDYVTASLSEKLQHVPKERLITPSPAVAGPTLEALRYAGHEPSLRELYSNLLATAIDEKTAREAHPAFVRIIEQMTPDEARIVGLFTLRRPFPLVSVLANRKDAPGGIDYLRHFSLLGYEAGCVHPELTPSYLDNLCRPGLAEVPDFDYYTAPGVYEPLEKHPIVLAAVAEVQKMEGRTPEVKQKALRVTSLGKQFCEACVVQRDRS